MAGKNPFAGYKEGKETSRQERKESKALQRFEAKKGIEKKIPGRPSMKGGKKGC